MNIWDIAIMQPMINIVIVLSDYLLNSFGLTIIVLTLVIRALMYPLTVKQLHATKAMQSIQPQLAELQKKYAKDRQKLAQEQMKLYKESGMSTMGCMVPMLIQLPIWLALYQAIMLVLAVAPEGLLNLSRYLYSWPVVYSLLPLNNSFLWLNLGTGDTLLAILVGASMWVQQKMVTPTSTDPRQQSQSRMMLWMMPLMFTFLSLTFPSGLALYWVISNIVSIVIQYYVTGWGGLFPGREITQPVRDGKYRMRIASVEAPQKRADTAADIAEPSSIGEEEGAVHEKSGDKRQDRGGSYPGGSKSIRTQSGKGRDNRSKRR